MKNLRRKKIAPAKSIAVRLEEAETRLENLLEIYINDYLNTHFFGEPIKRRREAKKIMELAGQHNDDAEGFIKVMGYIEFKKRASNKNMVSIIETAFTTVQELQKQQYSRFTKIKP